MKINLSVVTLLIVTALFSTTSLAARNNYTCGITAGQPLTNPDGPYDFTNPKHQPRIPIVTGAHFTREIELLTIKPVNQILSNIDYTLRAIPNYHRALYSVSKYQRLGGLMKKRFYTVECYFKRAIYFQPNDDISKMLFAMHLHLAGNDEQAKIQYENALRIRPKGAELNYNYGLLLFDLKQYKLAQQAADIAYSKGYPLQGLKNKLAKH